MLIQNLNPLVGNFSGSKYLNKSYFIERSKTAKHNFNDIEMFNDYFDGFKTFVFTGLWKQFGKVYFESCKGKN